MKFLAFILAVFALATFGLTTTAQSAEFKITDNLGMPISGAQVLIGYAPGIPFAGNLLTTDATGIVTTPTEWKAVLPVSIEAPGYIRTSYLNRLPSDEQIKLNPEQLKKKLEVKGVTEGFGNLKNDGKVDFALVIPSIEKQQIIQFDLSTVISPEIDVLRVATRSIKIPSNISLPDQRESYIIPIRINKPAYRMYFSTPGLYRINAIHGSFPLKKVVDELQSGKSIFELVNDFTFIQSGQMDVALNANQDEQNINISQVKFTEKRKYTAPQYPSDKILLSIGLSDDGGLLSASDLKRVFPGEAVDLSFPNNTNDKYFFSVLTNDFSAKTSGVNVHEILSLTKNQKDEPLEVGPISFSLQSSLDNSPPVLLEQISAPVVTPDGLTLVPPTLNNSIEPVATYAMLTEVEKVANGGAIGAERKTLVWEVTTLGWTSQIMLPQNTYKMDPSKTYRWDVLFLGRQKNLSSQSQGLKLKSALGVNAIEGITHVTRNSIDL